MFSDGDIYTFKATKYRWRFVRILINTEEAVHIRQYNRLYWRQPNIESFRKNNWSIGHLPMDEKELNTWGLIFVGNLPVEEDELEGYRIWAEDEDSGTFS